MDLFDKATKVAKDVGNSVKTTAVNVGNSIGNITKEQSELAGLKLQKNNIDKKLNSAYAEIGRKYVEYIQQCDTGVVFDVTEIVEKMKPDLEKMADLDVQIAEMDNRIKQNNLDRERKKAQELFDSEKKKLDKALDMDIISNEEYDEKLAAAQKKLDNFEQLRKIDMQLDMGIITKSEHEEKIRNILQ